MAWAKVDDQWFAHRKVVGLSLAARGLWTTALSWSCAQGTAHLPAHMIRFLAGGEDIDGLVDELVDAGLWIPDDDGWSIHDWDDYQRLSLSEKRAQAGRKGAKKRWEKTDGGNGQERDATPPENGKQVANGLPDDLPSTANGMAGNPARPGPSRPEPDPNPEKTARRKRAVALPDDWQPNDTHRRIAADEQVDVDREVSKFRDHAEANGRTLRDWDAGFRNWLRRAAEFGASTSTNGQRRPRDGPDEPPVDEFTETRRF